MKLNDINNELEKLKKTPNVKFEIIGYSLLKKPIYAFFVGKKKGKLILIEGAIHAREYINSFVLIEMIKYYSIKNLDFGVWIIPLVNPDGVGLCLEGLNFESLNKSKKRLLKKINNGKEDFSLWKANIRGVDLNVNFDALWGGGKQNIKLPASCNYIGKKPNSEIEVRNLIKFLQKIKPDLSLSFHSKGKVIYYGFECLTKGQIKRDLFIAKQIGKLNKYKTVKTKKSTGGFSDWVSMRYGVPAFTIEVGSDKLKHPIGTEWVDVIFNENKDIVFVCEKYI